MSLTNGLETGILEWYFGQGLGSDAAITIVTNFDIVLSKTTPADDYTNITKPSGGSYADEAVARATFFSDASSGSATHSSVVTFNTATADWGVVTHFVLTAASPLGVYGALDASVDIKNTDTVKFKANAIDVSLSGLWAHAGANVVLNNLLKYANTGDLPSTHYVGFSTTTPAADGTNFTEPSGNGYARASIGHDDYTAAVSGNPSSISTDTALTFAQATGSWGTLTYWGIFTAATGGTPVAFGALDSSLSIVTDDRVQIASGDLTFTLD